ncbi:MAG: hypothetical protein WBL85_11585 [Sedimentisphaerales bacterium]
MKYSLIKPINGSFLRLRYPSTGSAALTAGTLGTGKASRRIRKIT